MNRYEYSANNSGGGWWLDDNDWLALETAGWWVEWGGRYFCHSKYASLNDKPAGKPEPCAVEEQCHGHRRFDSLDELKACKEGRWLGTAAKAAIVEAETMVEAIRRWENVTRKDSTDEGCNCCGAPHSFSRVREGDDQGEYEYASGEEIVGILYPGSPRTLREAAERGDE